MEEKKETPKITVWLTSYNHGELLKESIESVLNQSYQDYEVYIIDDCSQDNSKEVIETYAKRDKRIKTIIHEKNIGESGLKWEIDNLQGEYVAILHGDDKWEKDKLEKQVNYLEQNRNIEACFTGVKIIDKNGEEYKGNHAYKKVFREENRSRFHWLRYFFENGNCLCHPSLLIRKEAYYKYNLLSEGLNSLPDFDKWIKICLHQDIYIIPEKLTCFRVHDSEKNASGDTAEKQRRLFVEEYLVYQNYFYISNKEELVKIFPESEEYIINNDCVLPFAIAQIFLKSDRPSKKLLGINKIYELCQDKERWSKIKSLYGYGAKEFDLDKQKFDIFGMISPERFLKMSLYINCGDGYTEENAIKQICYIPLKNIVNVQFKVKKCEGKEIKSIRFDFDEGKIRKCKIVEAYWNDKQNVRLKPVNGITINGEEYFYTIDPQYEVEAGEGVLNITLQTENIREREIESYIQKITCRYEKQLDSERAEKEKVIQEKRMVQNNLNEYRKYISIRALHKMFKKLNRNGK